MQSQDGPDTTFVSNISYYEGIYLGESRVWGEGLQDRETEREGERDWDERDEDPITVFRTGSYSLPWYEDLKQKHILSNVSHT